MAIRWLKGILALGVLAGAVRLLRLSEVAASSGGLDYGQLVLGVMGGLALFLYGMDKMADSLRQAAGDHMKSLLSKLTQNRIIGMFTGAFVTAVVQSSSVTTVMVVGFITAGLMTLPQAIGVILGADIGTTITAQIIAFKVTHYATLPIALGYFMVFTSKEEMTKQYGHMVMGLGLIFFGMGQMSTVMEPLRHSEPFVALLARMDNIALAILVSAIFTALIQSSAATIGIVIVLAAQGLLTLEGCIALSLGANIGTCATAGLASIGKPREAVRAALAHVLFKILGVLIMTPLIPQLAALVTMISPRGDPTNPLSIAAAMPRQVANAHTIFNVVLAFGFLPFSDLFARLIEWLLPDRPVPAGTTGRDLKPKYLDPSVIGTPVIALGLARREVSRIGDRLEQMMSGVPEAVFSGNVELAKEIRDLDDEVDALYESITSYLSEVGRGVVVGETSEEILEAITAANEFESIGDIIENNLTHLAEERHRLQAQLDDDIIADLRAFHALVNNSVRHAVAAFVTQNEATATLVNDMKDDVSAADAALRIKQAKWLRSETGPERMAAYTIEMDVLENLKRIYYHAKRVAKSVLHEIGGETPGPD